MSAKLYHAVNELMAQIGLHGEIDASHESVEKVMDVLHEMDGGVYNENFGKRAKRVKPAEADLLTEDEEGK